MGEPYRYKGKYNSGPMRIEAHDHEEGLAAIVIPGAKPVYVEGLDIPDVTNAMWRAAGQEPPVTLGRPDLASARDANGWISFRGVEVRKSDDGGVTFSVGGNTDTLSAAQARQCAAVVVALADEPPEPAGTLRRAVTVMRSDAERCGDVPGSFVSEVAAWLEIEAEAERRKLPDESGSVHVALRIARAYLGEGS